MWTGGGVARRSPNWSVYAHRLEETLLVLDKFSKEGNSLSTPRAGHQYFFNESIG